MAFRNVSVILQANVTAFTAQMGAAAASTKQLAREVNDVASKGDQTVKRLGVAMAAAGTALAAAFALAGKQAIDFEAQMRNVNSITHASEAEFQRTGDQVLDLSRRFPQSASTLAAGLYDIASSGFQGAEGMTVLHASVLAASAGLTTTAVAARGITAVLNAYGLSAGKASDVTDILFQTVNLGVVTFEELSSTIGDVVGTAAAAGVSFDQVGAGLATITLSGISASEASTSLNRVLQSLIDPSDAMRATLHGLGYESGVAALQALGLQGTMEALRKTTGGNIEELVKLFPEIRGARGALALMANEGQNAAEVFGQITDEEARAGAAQKAFDEQSKSTAFQLGLLKSSAQAFGIELGQTVLPAVRFVVEEITGFLHGIAELPGPVTTLVGIVGVLAAGVLTLGGGFLLLAPKISAAKKLFEELATTAPRLAAGLQTASLAAGAVTAALVIGAVILANYAKQKAEAAARTQRFVDALNAEQQGTENAARALVVKELAESHSLRTLLDLGIATSDVVDAILGQQDAVESVAAAMEAQIPEGYRYRDLHQDLVDALNGSDEAQKRLTSSFADGGPKAAKAVAGLTGIIGGLSDSNTDAALQLRETNKALADVGAGAAAPKKQLAALDAIFRDAASGAAELTARQKALAQSFSGFIDPIAAYRSALDEKTQTERSSFDSGASAAEDGMDRQERAFERASAARQQQLDDTIDAENDAFEERRRLEDADLAAAQNDLEARQRIADREIDNERRVLDERLRGIDRALDDERDALADRADVQSRAFEDEREALEARQRAESEALTQGVGESREEFQARKDLLEKRQRDEKDALDARKRAADRALEDERKNLNARTTAARREAEDARQILDDKAADQRRAFDDEKELLSQRGEAIRAAAEDEKRVMEDRQAALKRSLDDKDKAEKDQLEEQKRTNKAGAGSWREFKDDVKLSLAEYAAALEQRNQDFVNWQRNLVTVASRVGPDVAVQLAKLGVEAAPLVAQFANGTEADVNRAANALREGTRLGTEDAAKNIEFGMAVAAVKMSQGTTATVETIAAAMGASQGKVFQAGQALGLGLISSILAGIQTRIVEATNKNPALFSTPGFDPNKLIQGFAAGGIRDAAVSSRPLVMWAEPSTGGEAYIPRLGAPGKAKETLATAAGWYGMAVTPMAAGGIIGMPGWSAGGGQGAAARVVHVDVTVHANGVYETSALAPLVRREVRAGVDEGFAELDREMARR
jgi:TP901 family phage tail tape measure protein